VLVLEAQKMHPEPALVSRRMRSALQRRLAIALGGTFGAVGRLK